MRTTVLTDGNGDFQFAGLPTGIYVVAVEEVGYETVQETVRVDFGSPSELTLYLRKRSAVPSGENGDFVSVRELSIPSKAREEFHKGLKRRVKNDPAGSLTHFQRALAEFPSYYETYLEIGIAYQQLGQTGEAEKAIRKSIELSGERFADADFALGALLAEQRQYDDAEKAARQGLLLMPASWLGHYLLGRVLFGLNRFREAEESARKVLSLKRDFARVHILLANIHLRTRDHVSLLKDLDAYLALEPNGTMSVEARQLRVEVQQTLARTPPTLPAANAAP